MARKRKVSQDYSKQISELKIEIQELETELSNKRTTLSEKKKELKSLEKAQAKIEIERIQAEKEQRTKALIEKVVSSGLSFDEIEKMLAGKIDTNDKVESDDKAGEKSAKDKKEEQK